MVIDVDELAAEITKQALNKAKELVSQKVIASSGDGVSTSLLNLAKVLESTVGNQFQSWADRDGQFIAPHGTRFIHHKGPSTVFVIEQKPCFRTIQISSRVASYFSGSGGAWHLPFPYVVFLPYFVNLQFKGIGVYYSNSPVASLNQILYYNNLPNMVGGGEVLCHGSAERDIGINLGQRIESTIRGFWGSTFSDVAAGNWMGPNQPFKNINQWSKTSLLQITKVKWRPVSIKLGELVQNYAVASSAFACDRNRSLVKQVCQDVAPEVEGHILSSLKRVRIGKRDEELLNREIRSLLEQKLGSGSKKKAIKKKKKAKKA